MTPNQDRSRFEQLLSDELNKKTNYNKDLIEERNNAQQQQLSLGQTLRSEWADSQMDPLQREAIIAQRRSQLGGRVGTLSDLLGARGQYFSDILGRAMGAYDAEMADKMRREELTRQRQVYLDWLKSQAGDDDGGGEIDPSRLVLETVDDPNTPRPQKPGGRLLREQLGDIRRLTDQGWNPYVAAGTRILANPIDATRAVFSSEGLSHLKRLFGKEG